MWTAEARQRYGWTRRQEGPRLTDPEWALLEPLLPPQASMGRPWKHTLRTILDAILYLVRTGCAWSALPDWAPPRSTVYEWFRRLADGGWLERLHHALLLAVREHQGREASPTLGIVDGGFRRLSQHRLCELIGGTGQGPQQVSSSRGSCGAGR